MLGVMADVGSGEMIKDFLGRSFIEDFFENITSRLVPLFHQPEWSDGDCFWVKQCVQIVM